MTRTRIGLCIGFAMSALLFGTVKAGAACPPAPGWAEGRTAGCDLRVNSGIASLGTVSFDHERSFGSSGSLYTADCGTDADRCNDTFFEWNLDGYNGTPVTGSSCLTGGSCGQGPKGAGSDLSHIWTGMRANVILWKSLVLQNGWKACPGCTSSSENPHVDNLQIWGRHSELFRYLVIQDTLFRNSDDQMIHGTQVREEDGDIKAVVLQNVKFEQQSAYMTECGKRASRYPAMDSGCSGGPLRIPNNGADNSQQWDIWLIGVESELSIGGGSCPNYCMTNRVILVDTPRDTFNTSNFRGTLVQYDSIEQALAAGESEPPFLRLSCAGWSNPPAGCVSQRGPAGDTSGGSTPAPDPLPAPLLHD